MMASVGAKVRAIGTLADDLSGWLWLIFKAFFQLLRSQHRRIFWLLFKRQLFNAAVQSTMLIAIIALLLAWLMMSRALAIVPAGGEFLDFYAKTFVLVVGRDIGPMVAGLILIARSASAVTAEIGYMRLYSEFDALGAVNMSPVLTFLMPVVMAFTLSLPLMSFYFSLVCVLGAYGFVSVFNTDVITFEGFKRAFSENLGLADVLVFTVKTTVGGFLIGITSVYFGHRVNDRFTEVSRAIASANAAQLFGFFAINVFFISLVYL